ncbi:hypothetical protein KFK09_024184 [Dendrobium nobile]|uniref:GB1/RHD3-type G domain-containing protein n=1 Tax=Dendrobium nobile TaxID=94219 RepID=A0A8T3ADC6_DENNO|nr:hypothetical protein KFK09_024184 [Dendrobium nobile]
MARRSSGGGPAKLRRWTVGGRGASSFSSFSSCLDLFSRKLKFLVFTLLIGKSTLLNHLFHTKPQTTKGIWLARCVDIEPCTIIMDLEGSDGRGHGEQSALFAFAVSYIVLINMWFHDIGREHAASKPLLRTVLQGIMRLFSPHKTIYSLSYTPVENLEHMLRGDIQKIWDSVQKSLEHINTPLSEFFNVEVVAISSFEEKEEQFKEQLAKLQKRFFHSIAPSGLAGDRRGVISALGFSFTQQIWKAIKENKNIDLLAHEGMICFLFVMIAIVRCEEIANAKFDSFLNNEIIEAVQNGIVPDFAKKLSSILENCLIGYDKEAVYFDDSVRTLKRQQLESKLFQAFNKQFGTL